MEAWVVSMISFSNGVTVVAKSHWPMVRTMTVSTNLGARFISVQESSNRRSFNLGLAAPLRSRYFSRQSHQAQAGHEGAMDGATNALHEARFDLTHEWWTLLTTKS